MPRITIFLCLHKNGAAVRGSVLVAANTNTQKQNHRRNTHTTWVSRWDYETIYDGNMERSWLWSQQFGAFREMVGGYSRQWCRIPCTGRGF